MNAEAERFTFLVAGPEVDHIGPESPCYALPAFPPPHDFPMMVDPQGEPVCRYGDHKWRIGARPLNFGTDPDDIGSGRFLLTEANGELLKRCILWFMYGDRRDVSVSTLETYHQCLKPIFAFCSGLTRPIVASDLLRFFDRLEGALAQAIRPSLARTTMGLLYELWLAREHLGFTLLDPKEITRLRQLVPEHERRQTQFIPPRIWAYQAGRLQAFLQDFLDHKVNFEAALQELLSAYRNNFGSWARAPETAHGRRTSCRAEGKRIRGCTYLGSFAGFAERHRIREVIALWLFRPGTVWQDLNSRQTCVRLLTRYLNAIGLVGTAYLQCFSGMRRGEALSLRCNCLSVEHDSLLGDIHVLMRMLKHVVQHLAYGPAEPDLGEALH